MTITVLTDNLGWGELKGEWGLSFYIEYEGKRFLLDTGASDTFIRNAGKLGIDISGIDGAVISHAHYDHTGGLAAFLEVNAGAPVYLSPGAGENCYSRHGLTMKYIGMPKGVAAVHPERIIRPGGVTCISDGVYIVPHSTPGLQRLGLRNHQYVRKGIFYLPDGFSHEQTLVFETPSGLVLLNSCSHSGPDIIVDETLKAFPGAHIAAYIGGLHLFRMREGEIRAVSDRLAECGIDRICTGHCTGQKAFDIMRERFADKIEQFHCGMQIEI